MPPAYPIPTSSDKLSRHTLRGRPQSLSIRREELGNARAEHDRAEAILISMLKEMCNGKKNYLFSGGSGLRRLDLVALNETLSRHQLRLRASMSYSERMVNCRVTGNEWHGRTLFVLESAAPGVVAHTGGL
jgi:hypothetical protein